MSTPSSPTSQVEVAGGLDRISVHHDRPSLSLRPLLDEARYLPNRLYRAYLVIGQHRAHQDRAIGYRAADVVRVHHAVLIHRQVGDLEPELLQLVARVQHGVVLDAGGDDVVAGVPQREGRTLERCVVGLGSRRW